MSVLTLNENEYTAQPIVSTSLYDRFQCAEVADMKASADNKNAVVRWRFHEGQSSRSARLPFMEAKKKSMIRNANHALNTDGFIGNAWRSRTNINSDQLLPACV